MPHVSREQSRETARQLDKLPELLAALEQMANEKKAAHEQAREYAIKYGRPYNDWAEAQAHMAAEVLRLVSRYKE
jgi:hypothetical protein